MWLNLQGSKFCSLLVSLIHIKTVTIYHVIPDDHYPTNSMVNTFLHSLQNAEKIFTSNNQVKFPPGIFHLPPLDFIIYGVYNFLI